MKDLSLLIMLLLSTTIAFAQPEIPIDFESEASIYSFSDFGGGVATVIDNPQVSGINTSAKVGQMVKFAGEVFGGSTLVLADTIDFGDNNAIKMKVFSNRVDAPVLFKLEGPTPTEVTSRTTVANEWEELTFNFNGFTEGIYTGITIIYDLGVVGDGSADFILLFDDIEFTTVEAEGGVRLPIDFESDTLNYVFSDFAGGVGSVIDNPQSSGINTSAKVGQMVKFAGEVYGGSTLALGGPIDFGDNNAISMKVFANRIDAPVTFKLEGPAPVEVVARTTVANEWEELTFNFNGLTGGVYTAITIIYDLGVVGDGSADFTLLFDDIALTMDDSESVQIPIDFESTSLNYVFADFGGGVATIIDNPQSSGINTSAKVGQMVKFAGEVFGGSTLSLGGPIDFAGNTSISMKVYSNRVGAPVLLKLEGAVPVEVSATTTVANEWEELDFDFSGMTDAVYTGITIIYDLGTVGDGGADFTLLFDDIVFTGTTRVVDLEILDVNIYPNPTVDFLNIQSKEEIKNVIVYSLSGRQLISVIPENYQSRVDLTSLPSGTYLVKIAIGEQEGMTKIIKQ
ncbi:T9SS type A sorting domain-containing protein [Flavilitoribacter nigricans]|nr:T9SS type A sorting domain-containing protein [Flavilitoribacter nigricans]